jgi:hypothetical protein
MPRTIVENELRVECLVKIIKRYLECESQCVCLSRWDGLTANQVGTDQIPEVNREFGPVKVVPGSNEEQQKDEEASEPLAARLVDGVALLETVSEKGEVTFRQVPWFVDRHNGLETDPLKAKRNKLFGVMPSKGDKLILMAKLTSLDKSPLIVGTAGVACHLRIVP